MTSNEADGSSKSKIDNWKEYAIANIAKIKGGGTPSTKTPSYWNGNIPWITPKDLSVQKSKYIERGSRNITEKGLSNSNANLIPPNSIILSTRAPIGYIAISRNALTTNQGCHALIPSDSIDTEFLYYLLKENVEFLKSQSNGSTFGELSGKTLRELKFLFPTLYEQKAIAKILSDLDSKIELNQKMNKTLEAIAQAIFKHWFIDFEFPNEDGKPYKSSGGVMVDSDWGEIPKGWEVTNLGYHIKFKKGKKPVEINSNEDPNLIPIISMEMLEGGHPNLGNPLGMNIASKYDPVMVMDGASSGRVEIGFEGIVGSTFASVTSNSDRVSNFYLYHTLKVIEHEIRNNPTGTSIPHTDKSKISKMKTLIPDRRVLHLFDEFIRVSIDTIVKNRKVIIILAEIKNLELPRLMTGKIRVPLEE